ncbi:MAG: glycosyltransferase family 4 protein, partial [Thermodesulfobacteriota bacterium]|nr:glycosyltransferase family 4 protein [Thermodesulfobacteriota bacterium]
MMGEKPKVVVVGPLPPPVHGVTVYIQRILNSGLKDNFEVRHLDTSDHRTVGNIGALDIGNFTLAFKSYAQLVKMCLKSRPDLVYVPISQTFLGFFRDAFYIVVPRLFFRSKIVIHLPGGYFGSFYDQSGLPTRKGIDFVMRFVDRVVVLGEVMRPIFRKWFDDSQIDVAPNGTDLVVKGVDKKLQGTGSARVFTFMSSLMRTKGIVEFIKAALLALDKHPQSVFNVAGEWWPQEPDLRPEVESMLAASPHGDKIVFHGLVTGEEKEKLLFETDVFVLPTYYPFEGHPTVIIEAMAAGCPVISTEHAAIPETVIHGETGIIVDKGDAGSLATAMFELIENDMRFKSMARGSYARYKENYTVEKS